MRNILFVCTGNTCRSPMAGALFADLLNKKEKVDVFVSSAGIYAFEGDPASHLAIEVLRQEFGLDLTSHRARVLDENHIRRAWLILAMTDNHKRMILDVYPEAADKIYTLKDYAEMNRSGSDIIDPFGGNYETYKQCAYEIESALMNIIDKVFDNKD